MQDSHPWGMAQTHTPDSLALRPDPISSIVAVRGIWRVRERDRRSGIIVGEKQVKNVWTSFGLTLLASGALPQNIYLAVENAGTIVNATVSSGANSITTNLQVHQAGDTQIVASVGGINQEVLTFSSAVVNSDSSCTYTLSSPTTKTHTRLDLACRQVYTSDTMINVVNEQQYDSVNFPNQRAPMSGGYSAGTGNWTYQFFYAGPTLQTTLMIVGMCDNATIGAGNLLNHFTLGYTHNNVNNDLEIDGSLTLTNM